MGRFWVGLAVVGSLLLAGCAGLNPTGGADGSRPGVAAKQDAKLPEVSIDIAIDQAALDVSIRKAKEFEALVARAEGGDDDAQFELAERYAHGREVEADPAQAKQWYLRAADSGHEKSRAMLVTSYIRDTLIGYEPKAEFVKILPYLRDAAKGGDVVAQEILAKKYANGEEVPRDYYEARRWLQALADRGFMNAQYSLAVMYHSGLGVEPDPRTAYKWFEAAAKQGDGRSQYMVAVMNYYGRGVDQSLSTAREWAVKAAQQDDAEIKRQAINLLSTLTSLGVTSAPKPAAPAPGDKTAPVDSKAPAPAKPASQKPDPKAPAASAVDTLPPKKP